MNQEQDVLDAAKKNIEKGGKKKNNPYGKKNKMEIARMTKGNWGKIKAFFDVKIKGITIKGFKLIEGIEGMFVGSPSIKKEDNSYDNIITLEKDTNEDLRKLANSYYKEN